MFPSHDRTGKHRPSLVILDPLYALTESDNFMTEAASRMLPLKRMRDEFGTSFAVVHHTKKGTDETSRLDAWGAQFLNAFLEVGWQIRPESGTDHRVQIRRHFKTHANRDTGTFEVNIDTDRGIFQVVESAPEPENSPSNDVDAVFFASPRTGAEVRSHLGLSHRQKAVRWAARQVRDGQLREVQHNGAKAWVIADLWEDGNARDDT